MTSIITEYQNAWYLLYLLMSFEIIVQSWLLCDCFYTWLSPARSQIINLCRNKNFTTSTLQSAIIPGQVTFWLNAMKQMQMPGEVWRTIFKAGFREDYPSNIRAMLARQISESWKFAIFGILSLQFFFWEILLFKELDTRGLTSMRCPL